MKLNVPPRTDDSIYYVSRLDLTVEDGCMSATDRTIVSVSRRRTQRIIGRAIRRDWWTPSLMTTTAHSWTFTDCKEARRP